MRTASFIWYSHPERPTVNLSWDYDRETSEYFILEIDLEGSKILNNQIVNYSQDLIKEGVRIPVGMHWNDSDLYLSISGLVYHFRHRPSYMDLIESDQGDGNLKAQMPGKIMQINCALDSNVERGDLLLIMESMKMENKILAPISGKVTELLVCADELVEADQLLVVIDGSDE